MRFFITLLVLSILISLYLTHQARAEIRWEGNFSGNWHRNWNAQVYNGWDNIQVVRDPKFDRVLRVHYVQGQFGPDAGFQFFAPLPEEVQQDALYLSYYVRFSPDFEWRLGGKLPGFISGNPNDVSGGARPNGYNGFSSRYMWIQNSLSTYLYVPTQPAVPPKEGIWGWERVLNFRFQPGKWHHLVQKVQLNTSGHFDGSFEIWADGAQIAQADNILYRCNDFGIDGIYFSTFYGGSGDDWAPTRSGNYADFAQFTVSTTNPINPGERASLSPAPTPILTSTPASARSQGQCVSLY